MDKLIFQASMLFCLLCSVHVFGQAEQAELLGQWDDPSIIGSSAYQNRYNEVWGYAINGHEYAIIGSTRGTHIIDVTDPESPFEAFFVAGKSMGAHIVHRDYHDYKGYLYAVADEGGSSLQIIDLNKLPDAVSIVYDAHDLVITTHNIFIDTSSALLYLCAAKGGTSGYSPLRVLDISDPPEPRFVNSYNKFGTNYFISQVHDAYVRRDTAFLNCGPGGLVIANFTNPESPATLAILTPGDYPQSGYNHSGWLSDDGRYYYMADENHGLDIKLLDLSDISNPEIVGTFNAGSSAQTSIPHNLIASCDRLYVSYYYDGYQVFDISDPAAPVLSRSYDTYPGADGNSYKGAWGIYPFLPSGNVLVSDMQTGLYVFGPDTDCGLVSSIHAPAQKRNENHRFSVFPTISPDGTFNVSSLYPSTGQEIMMRIYQSNGQCVIAQRAVLNGQTTSVHAPFAEGMYFMHLSASGYQEWHSIFISK